MISQRKLLTPVGRKLTIDLPEIYAPKVTIQCDVSTFKFIVPYLFLDKNCWSISGLYFFFNSILAQIRNN